MYDACCKLHKSYHSKYFYNPTLIINNENFKNSSLMRSVNESLKKSIIKIKDSYSEKSKDKFKKIINAEINGVKHINSDTHSILDVTIFSGIWVGLLSTYLVYYFINK